jgi:uncharacterized protein YbaP (TraB family)
MRPFAVILFSLSVLLCPFTLQGQRSVLLSFTPEGATSASYILATFEHPRIGAYPISEVASGILPEVNTVAFEWLPESYEIEKEYGLMQMQEQQNLKRYYKREDNIRYELFILEKMGQEVEDYAMTYPLFTMELFRRKFLDQGRHYHRDQVFTAANDAIKPMLSMLSVQMLAEELKKISWENQADILSSYVNTFDAFQTARNNMLQLYTAQDLEGIASQMEKVEHPIFLSGYFSAVNSILASKMEQLARGQSVLFVVNAERLGGEYGILQMLTEGGARLEERNVRIQQAVEDITDIPDQTDQTGGKDIQPDGFPEELLVADTGSDTNPEEWVVKWSEEKRSGSNRSPASDPFFDRYDHLAADTAFLSEWYELRSNDAFFSIMMPEKTTWESSTTNSINGPIKTVTASANHARSDLFYSIGYTIYPPNFDPEYRAPFFDDFVNRSARKWKGNVIDQRVLSHPEYTGRSFVVSVNDSFYVRSDLILKGNVLYQLLCGGPGDRLYTSYSGEFFRSFRLDEGKSGNWFLHEDPAFTCFFPRQPLIDRQTINTQYGPLRLTTYNADDFENGLSYFVSTNVYPSGYKLKKESAFYKDLIADAERQYFGRAVSVEKIKKGKFTGREVVLNLNDGNVYRMHFFIDNNAVYQYLVGGSSSAIQSANVDFFLDEFRFR